MQVQLLHMVSSNNASTNNDSRKEDKQMARETMVTRTITTTKAVVLCLELVKAEPFNETVILPRTYKDEKQLMKAISKVVDNDNQKAVHVVSTEIIETLYGMTEQEFINQAKALPPRGTKEVVEETTEQPKTEETPII
jgi:hypothetical protein